MTAKLFLFCIVASAIFVARGYAIKIACLPYDQYRMRLMLFVKDFREGFRKHILKKGEENG